MRVLLSAYACEPNRGSEAAAGWHWAIELARLGHEVWVITRANNQSSIAEVLNTTLISKLHFVYYDLPLWARWWKRGGRGVYLYYFLWQWGAYRLAKSLIQQESFDLVHHITFGVFRQPSFMAFLGLPFIFGPVGGGERTPYALRKSLPLGGYMLDLLRDVSNWLTSIEPITRSTLKRSTLILCKTKETLLCIPEQYQDKCLVYLELGFDPTLKNSHRQNLATKKPVKDGDLRILYVGRLIYWKGLHLGLKAFAQLRQTFNSKLTVIGSGPDAKWMNSLAEKLEINDAIDWISWMPQEQLMQYYSDYDVFLFPSLHDSSGYVVVEALSHGLPVVCLDLGGPGVIVDDSCGRIVKTEHLNETAVIQDLSDALKELASNTKLLTKLSRGALIRSQDFHWEKVVGKMYAKIEQDNFMKSSID